MATNKQKAGLAVTGSLLAALTIATPFVAKWEGFEPVAKHEFVDPPGVITWCFGRTNYDDPTVKPGTRFTKEECEKQLQETLPRYAAQAHVCIPKLLDLPPPTMAAIISFTYNLGEGNLCKSRVARYLNETPPDIREACDAMLAFTRANGVVLQGLVSRRRDERTLCLKGLQ